MVEGDENVLWFDVQMNKLLRMDVPEEKKQKVLSHHSFHITKFMSPPRSVDF